MNQRVGDNLEGIFASLDAEPKGRMFVVVSGRLNTMMVHGVFDTEETAQAWAARADKWRGRHHPLYPHRVETIQREPPLFPEFSADED